MSGRGDHKVREMSDLGIGNGCPGLGGRALVVGIGIGP